jgi:hypothetical protein
VRILVLVKYLLVTAVVFSSIVSFAASGTFRGTLIQDPVTQDSRKWLYLQSANGSVRRVEISHAQLVYAEEISRKGHPAKASEALRRGAELRITASQDETGEWAATRVEIVEIPPK